MVSLGVFVFISYSRRDSDGRTAMSFGKSRAQLADPEKNKVTFDDVAGAEEEKGTAGSCRFLEKSENIRILARRSDGHLLVGPPGTGKTLLARAVAEKRKCRSFPSADQIL